MKLGLYTDELADAKVDLLAVGTLSDEPDRGLAFGHLNRKLDGELERCCREERFGGHLGQTLMFHTGGVLPARRVLVFGFGARGEYGAGAARAFARTVIERAETVGARSVALQLTVTDLPAAPEHILGLFRALAEGARLGAYRFDVEDAGPKEVRIAFVAEDVHGLRGAQLRDALRVGDAVATGTNYARAVTEAGAGRLDPPSWIERAKQVAKADGVALKQLGARDMERNRLGLTLAVGEGARREPSVLHLSYRPEQVRRNGPQVVLLGIARAPEAASTAEVAGAAAVLAAMKVIAKLEVDAVVHGILVCADPGPTLRAGALIEAKDGVMVEAADRVHGATLLTADGLAYASEQGAKAIIDVGGYLDLPPVLGPEAAGLFTASSSLEAQLVEAGRAAGEPLWPLPLWTAYEKGLKGRRGSLRQRSRTPSAPERAAFLGRFVDDAVEWAHIDLSGPAEGQPDGASGTGFGVRLLCAYVLRAASGAQSGT